MASSKVGGRSGPILTRGRGGCSTIVRSILLDHQQPIISAYARSVCGTGRQSARLSRGAGLVEPDASDDDQIKRY
jgi:hypothetical protein